jgi:UDP-N-acetylmuramoylalanine--D-glutamate ligase
VSTRVLVYGLGASGASVVRHLQADGVEVVAADDRGEEEAAATARSLGVELVVRPDAGELARLVSSVSEVVVSPGVPAHHLLFSSSPTPVVGEIELAWRRARMPICAVTGTNGKTTVVTLVEAMLRASGISALSAGNIGLPLLDALDTVPAPDVVVAEVSSFQLARTVEFAPAVGAWCNFSPDHLDWHGTVEAYRTAKSRIWLHAGPGVTAVANAEDPVVRRAGDDAAARGATLVRFGVDEGEFQRIGDRLVGPGGETLVGVSELRRSLPHDLSNALCAAAAAAALGASSTGCGEALRAFAGLPHRVERVGEANGVEFYDDSKATTPGATLAALAGFDRAVLIAGGRNKGLDLSVLRAGAPRLRAVVTIGEAAAEMGEVFAGACPVVPAVTMTDAVEAAASLARPGDAVLLSPACASFDWYRSYGERGDDFARAVRSLRGPRAGAGGSSPCATDPGAA